MNEIFPAVLVSMLLLIESTCSAVAGEDRSGTRSTEQHRPPGATAQSLSSAETDMVLLKVNGLEKAWQRVAELRAAGATKAVIKELEGMIHRCPSANGLKLTLARHQMSTESGFTQAGSTLDQIKDCPQGVLREKLILKAMMQVFQHDLDAAERLLEQSDSLAIEPLLNGSAGGWAEGWVTLSQARLSAGENTKAMETAQRAIKCAPQETAGYVQYGKALARMGRTHEAIDEYSRAIALDPRVTPAYFQRAAANLELGRTDLYQQDLEQLRKLCTNRFHDSCTLEEWNLGLVEAPEIPDAEKITRITAVLKKQFRPVPALIKTYLLLGAHRFFEARVCLENPIWNQQKLSKREQRDYLVLKAALLANTEKQAEAAKLMDYVEKHYDISIDCVVTDQAPGWLILAESYYDKGDFSTARKFAQRADRLRPNAPEAMRTMGRCAARVGHFQEGLDYMSRGLKHYPDSSSLLKERAALYFASGKTKEALADLDRLKKLPGNEHWTFLGIQSLSIKYTTDLTRLGRQVEQAGASESALRLKAVLTSIDKEQNPQKKGELMLAKAELELLAGNYKAALDDATASVRLNKDTHRAHAIKAASLLHLRRPEEAKQERQRTIELYSLERRSIGSTQKSNHPE